MQPSAPVIRPDHFDFSEEESPFNMADAIGLNYTNRQFTTAAWESFLQQLPKAAKLTTLIMPNLTDEQFRSLLNRIPNEFFEKLTYLDLKSPTMTRFHQNFVSGPVPAMPKAPFIDTSIGPFTDQTELDFSDKQFSDRGFAILIEDLSQTTQVKSLKLNYLSPAKLHALRGLPPDFLSRLETLVLKGEKDEIDMVSLVALLNNAANLTSLALENFEVQNTPLAYFFNHFRPSLRILSLANNSLDEFCLLLIFPFFQAGRPLNTLTHLDLQRNKIALVQPFFLFSALFSGLKVLNLAENRLSHEELQRISNHLPLIEKEFYITLYPQRVFPSPNYFEIEENLRQFNIATNLPSDVKRPQRTSELPKPQQLDLIGGVVKEFMTHQNPQASLLQTLNRIFGDIKYLTLWNLLLELALRLSFIPEDVSPDGNCLFASVAKNVQMPHEMLRALVVYQEKLNREFYSLFFAQEDGDEVGFDRHLEAMAKHSIWGGEIELAAMQELLRRPLIVFNPRHPLILVNGQFRPPEICIHGQESDAVRPIFLFNMIRPKPPEEILPGQPPFDDHHYQALLPKGVEESEQCAWPAHLAKPPANDTPALLFNDPNITVENGIIRLFYFIQNGTLKLENLAITSLGALKALNEWLPPSGGLIHSLQLSQVTFSAECWRYFLQNITNTQSVTSFTFLNISLEQLDALAGKSDFFSKMGYLDFSGSAVDEPQGFINPLIQILNSATKLRALNLSGRMLGNSLLTPLFNCAHLFTREIDLTHNGITDLTCLPLLPPKTDFCHNAIPAPSLVAYLSDLHAATVLIQKNSLLLLPQAVEYSQADVEAINDIFQPKRAELSKIYTFTRLTNDTIWELIGNEMGMPNLADTVYAYYSRMSKEQALAMCKSPLQNPISLMLFLPDILQCEITIHYADKPPETVGRIRTGTLLTVFKDEGNTYFLLTKK